MSLSFNTIIISSMFVNGSRESHHDTFRNCVLRSDLGRKRSAKEQDDI